MLVLGSPLALTQTFPLKVLLVACYEAKSIAFALEGSRVDRVTA